MILYLYYHNNPLMFHFPPLIWSFPISPSTLSIPDSGVLFSHGCFKHCSAVGRFSGAKSRIGIKKSANSRASFTDNLNLSESNRFRGVFFILRILFRSPYRSKYSLDRSPPTAIWFYTLKKIYKNLFHTRNRIRERNWNLKESLSVACLVGRKWNVT